MIEAQVIKVLKKEIKERYNRESDPKLTDNLIDDLGLDSLDRLELLIELEDETGVDFEQSQSQEINTVQDVVELIERFKK